MGTATYYLPPIKGAKQLSIQDKLYKKISAEYDARMAEIKQLSPAKIIACAYEIAIKDDLRLCFDAGEVSTETAKALLSLEKPLEHVYRQWLETDFSSYMDDLRACMESEAQHILRQERMQAKSTTTRISSRTTQGAR